jgi:hypothetical protein
VGVFVEEKLVLEEKEMENTYYFLATIHRCIGR